MMDSPIMVTGSHRSGTTFVGRMLSLPKNIGYIPEPLNIDIGIKGLTHKFPYIYEGSSLENHYAKLVSDIMAFRAVYNRPVLNKGGKSLLEKSLQLVLKSKGNCAYLMAKYNPITNRILIKDPVFCLSSEWLHHKFDFQVVVLFRHPAAFVGSLKRLGWEPPLKQFLEQDDLMKDYLYEYFDKITNKSNSIIERYALTWLCINKVLINYVKRNPRMIAVKHEDVSKSPVGEFAKLYGKLDLEFNEQIREKIKEYTGQHNKVDPIKNKVHVLKRDSKNNIKRWKNILTEEEILIIREITASISDQIYGDEEW